MKRTFSRREPTLARLLRPVETTSDTKVRTLIVDDSPFMLKILAQILEETDLFDLVGTATDAYQALRHVSALSPELVLMDIHMPGLNGIQATRFMKRSEHPPVDILISSDSSSMARSSTEQAGADGFVSKGGDFRQRVIPALQKLFGAGGATSARRGEFLFSPPVTETRITAHESPCAKRFRDMGRTSSSQQHLLTAASDLLWEKSYHSVTVDEICARAGVLKGKSLSFL